MASAQLRRVGVKIAQDSWGIAEREMPKREVPLGSSISVGEARREVVEYR